MKNENTTKPNKKELKSTLVESIEKVLKLDKDKEKSRKLRKVIRDAAKQITKKYLSKLKDRKAAESDSKDTASALRKNQRTTVQRKRKNTEPGINL